MKEDTFQQILSQLPESAYDDLEKARPWIVDKFLSLQPETVLGFIVAIIIIGSLFEISRRIWKELKNQLKGGIP